MINEGYKFSPAATELTRIALESTWSAATLCGEGSSTPYASNGQCLSSALAIAIIFGFEPRISYVGKLNPNLPPDETHFYNISPDGVRRDFTRDQFPEDTIIDEGELIDPKSFPSEETRQKVAYLVEGVLSWFTHPKYFEYIHKFALPGSLLYDIVAPKAI